MRKHKPKKKKQKESPPVKYSPDMPEARDEGPRLVPLPPEVIPVLPDHARYIALADEALGNKPKVLRKPKP